MPLRHAAKTDRGKRRQENNDTFRSVPNERLFLVADGEGRSLDDQLGAEVACDAIAEFLERTQRGAGNRLSDAIRFANQRIVELMQRDRERSDRERIELDWNGPASTIVAAHFDEGTLTVAHVGDSRCYLLRDGAIRRLTRDHSLLEDYKDARGGMTEEEIRNFPHKNVMTRSLGVLEDVAVDVSELPVSDGDIILLCTDGLTGAVGDSEIANVVLQSRADLMRAVTNLIRAANEAGGDDNSTAMLIEYLK